MIADESEHRRRVTTRYPDLDAQMVPTWGDVIAGDYVPWDSERDRPRYLIDMTDAEEGVAEALGRLRQV